MTKITAESPGDDAGIRAVHRSAFPGDDEAELVDNLRESAAFDPSLSLVARDGGSVIGHALLTPVEVDSVERSGVDNRTESVDDEWEALVLAPVAVAPPCQDEGVGSELISASLNRARRDDRDAVFLHGSPAFYPRFGFRPAGELGFENPFDTPAPEFMVAVLTDAEPPGGRLCYPAAFDSL